MRFIFTLCLCVFTMAIPGYSQDSKRPNVLFIISDDLSAEALGSYGNVQADTPNIDRLASEGVRFTRAYCQFPICGPSRAAIMSGLYPENTGIMSNGMSDRFEGVLGDRPSLAEYFRVSGYHTARVSKIYHMRVPGDITAGVDGPDHVESWSERHNCQGAEWDSSGAHEHLSNERLRRTPDTHYSLGFGSAFYVVKGDTDGSEQPDVQAATKAIEVLEERKDESFFLAVGLVRPHVPLVAPGSFYEPFPFEKMNLPRKVDGDWDDIPRKGITRSSRSMGMEGKLDSQRKVLSAYYASVSFMDAQVGRILDSVDRLGLRDNTIVVFTSDHGYHLGEHDFWQKVSLHEESTRIPLIISVPGGEPGTATTLAEQIDLYPTLAELAGLDVPEHCQGVSLIGALDEPDSVAREMAYTVTRAGSVVRIDGWAYIRHTDGTRELYDMKADQKQYRNLVGVAEYGEKLVELEGIRVKHVAKIVL